MAKPFLLEQSMRWYGPTDVVPLEHIRQAGCTSVVTALHHIPAGAVWPLKDIEERRRTIAAAGMQWKVIESLPVSEDIKRQRGNFRAHIENYKQSLRNVAACGLKVVTYNFMPVLDWIRTDVSYTLPDGSKALYFNRTSFVAFDVFLLERTGAKADYDATEIANAATWLANAGTDEVENVKRNCMLGLPGSDEAFTREKILELLDGYSGITANKLKEHLAYFLKEIVPVAAACGLQMAIHPDDPPYSVLGLPRIVSTQDDIDFILSVCNDAANGICFCTGSLGARPDNDINKMIKRFGERIHFLHMRNTLRDEAGNFYEAAHLNGDTDMYSVMQQIFELQQQRQCSLPMRPDHGHQMLDDLHKKTYPGYSAIGRLKGLAELRGLEYAISKQYLQQQK